jgi:hypothetical protein
VPEQIDYIPQPPMPLFMGPMEPLYAQTSGSSLDNELAQLWDGDPLNWVKLKDAAQYTNHLGREGQNSLQEEYPCPATCPLPTTSGVWA